MSLLVPNTISIITLYFASDFTTLFIAFILYGLGSGSGPLNAMSIAECCSPKIRGTMLDVTFAMFVFGLGSARFLGSFVHWRILAVLSYVPLIIALVVLLASPDSPAWLASQGRFQECTKSFNWFRGEEEKEELDKLIEWQDRVIAKKRTDRSGIFRRITEAFLDKAFLKATLITFVCVVHLDVCGKLAIVSYMDVVNAITGDPERAGYYTFVIDMCNLAGTCISAAAVTQIKRRHLMFGVGVPCVTVLYAFCAVSYLSHLGVLPMKISWLPFTLMLVYLLLLNGGILGTLFTVQGEIYPLAHRGIGMGVGSVIFGVCSFVTMKTTPSLLQYLGVHGMFFVSAVGVSLILIFFYFYLPETFNKTLQKIEVELKDNEEDECSNIEANEKMLRNK
ncbi:hypothetical protein JYU34_009946 [Plutella xylostella]|uniref:Major facilitator superfamily (MFS) profile domain-containing protein n=1 Tax=Plutella xylostella TaxID=51655 RepID=A0ABQ7QKP1_PLUXY|nr:hypothetical protein JYU34_009946 [Plutella xylostella]